MGCCETREPPKKRYVFLIKHGEREDYSKQTGVDKYKLKQGGIDPILTDLGHQQAIETGQFLRKYLQDVEAKDGKRFDKIVVHSSPFVRTMSTAARICQ